MTGSPYEHLIDGELCVHPPRPGDRDGHYPSRRGLVIESPVVRDLWDAELDARDADAEERWWADKRARQAACPHENVQETRVERLGHTVWRCAAPRCGDGAVVGTPGTFAHPAPTRPEETS